MKTTLAIVAVLLAAAGVGATLLALGYQIFMGWVGTSPDAARSEAGTPSPS